MRKLGKINMMIYCDLGWSDKPLLLITNQHLHTRRHQDSHTHVDDVQDDDDVDEDHNVDDIDYDDVDDDDDEEELTFLHTRLKWRVKAGLRNPGLTSVIPQSCQLFLSSRWWAWLWPWDFYLCPFDGKTRWRQERRWARLWWLRWFCPRTSISNVDTR